MNYVYNVLPHPVCERMKKRYKYHAIEASSDGSSGIPEISLDFSFGFGDANYSDKVLILQIVGSDDVQNVDTATTPSSKAIHINSLILAARSTFFRKLFSNGMRDSEQKRVTLHIEASEEVSFMNLLKYVYSNNLPTTFDALMNLLMIADKFEVVSCLRDSTISLLDLPMTTESASIYLDLPPTLLASPMIEPLIYAAKQFLVANFNDLRKFKYEATDLSLKGIQVILSSDDLQVTSEFEVYVAALEWARKHYPDAGERREVLKTHLLHLIRFPFMTAKELTEEVQTCSDIDPETASKIIIRALSYKSETPDRKRCLLAEECNAASRQFVERAYIGIPFKVKVVELKPRTQKYEVYLDITRGKLERIFPVGRLLSETFHLGALQLNFVGLCNLEPSNYHYFWLAIHTSGPSTYTLDYVLSLRLKFLEEFKFWCNGSIAITEPARTTYLVCTPWFGFIDDDNCFFNDVFHLKVEITIKK